MKQSGRIWNQTMNDAMLSWGFTRLSCESCIYYRKTETGTIISAVHVNDFLSVATSKTENESFKTQMKSLWTISDLGEAKHCVGIAISRNVPERTVRLSHKALIVATSSCKAEYTAAFDSVVTADSASSQPSRAT